MENEETAVNWPYLGTDAWDTPHKPKMPDELAKRVAFAMERLETRQPGILAGQWERERAAYEAEHEARLARIASWSKPKPVPLKTPWYMRFIPGRHNSAGMNILAVVLSPITFVAAWIFFFGMLTYGLLSGKPEYML